MSEFHGTRIFNREQTQHWLLASIISLTVLIAGCGSSDSAGPLLTPGSGGTGSAEPIYAQGMISDEEPLTVNGVSYDTTMAAVVDDQDQPVSKDMLASGMVVEISGDVGIADTKNGSAAVVRIRSFARGKIARILDTGFVMNGLAIRTDSNTKQEDSVVIEAGEPVEVFGFIDHESGVALATYIRPDQFDTLKLTGSVEFYDYDSGHLVVNGLSLETGNDSGWSIQNGNRIVVLANPGAGPANSTVVRIDPEREPLPEFGVVSIEGIVGQFSSLTGFAVNGLPVDATSASVSGSPGIGIETGWRVAVTGRVIDDQIRAETITVLSTQPGVSMRGF
jgi:hypothetical protein